jgi:hypothetical protein
MFITPLTSILLQPVRQVQQEMRGSLGTPETQGQMELLGLLEILAILVLTVYLGTLVQLAMQGAKEEKAV